MRIEVREYKIYKYSEASEELKDKIRDYFSCYEHLYDHYMEERIATLVALAKELNARLDYSLSCVPDRGEFISFFHDHDNLSVDHLVADECPLTGVYYDADIIEDIQKEGINVAICNYIESIHEEYAFMLTDEYISDLCEANNYEFYETGELV